MDKRVKLPENQSFGADSWLERMWKRGCPSVIVHDFWDSPFGNHSSPIHQIGRSEVLSTLTSALDLIKCTYSYKVYTVIRYNLLIVDHTMEGEKNNEWCDQSETGQGIKAFFT